MEHEQPCSERLGFQLGIQPVCTGALAAKAFQGHVARVGLMMRVMKVPFRVSNRMKSILLFVRVGCDSLAGMQTSFSIRLPRFAVLAMFAMCASVHAGGNAEEDPMVTFHIETAQAENPKLVFPLEVGGKTRYFRRMPEIAVRDIQAFRPFPGDDGANTYGVIFQLKNNAARRLNNITTANQGRMLLAMTNGRPVDMVRIDQPVDDGFIVIWKGVTEADIRTYDKDLPRIGEEKKKRR